MGSSLLFGSGPRIPAPSLGRRRASRLARGARVATALALAASVGGSCSSSSPTSSATPTPGPNTVALGSLSPAVTQFYAVPFHTSTAGTLSLTVNWTNTADVILAGIATSACTTPAYLSSSCVFLAEDGSSETTATKIVTAGGVAPGTYVVIIQNQGPNDETITYTLNLTPS